MLLTSTRATKPAWKLCGYGWRDGPRGPASAHPPAATRISVGDTCLHRGFVGLISREPARAVPLTRGHLGKVQGSGNPRISASIFTRPGPTPPGNKAILVMKRLVRSPLPVPKATLPGVSTLSTAVAMTLPGLPVRAQPHNDIVRGHRQVKVAMDVKGDAVGPWGAGALDTVRERTQQSQLRPACRYASPEPSPRCQAPY